MSDALVQRHRDMALRIARGFVRKLPPNIEREDIEQAALIGLWKWCVAHPDSSHPGWHGGLVTRIRGAIIDWLRAEDWLPRRTRAAGDGPQVIRLEDLASGDGPGWEDTLPDDDDGARDARLDALEALRADMPERERHIVMETFARGAMQEDMARDLGVSGARVSQLLTRATRTMREHLEREREIASPVSVQVLATPKFRVRDFKRELWLARRNELLQHMGGGRSVREASLSLGVPVGTMLRWCSSTQMRWVTLIDKPDPISSAVRKRGRELVVAALRAEEGSARRSAPLLRLSPATLCRWRRILIPDSPTCSPGTRPRVPSSTLARLYEQGLSQRRIAKEVGLHHASVAHALTKQGIVGRVNTRDDVSAQACARLRADNLSNRQIAQRLGCSIGTVTNRLSTPLPLAKCGAP